MNKISIVMPYYNSASIIPIQLERWEKYSQKVIDNIKIIIIDDGSREEQKILTALPETLKVTVEVYEILVDIPWNECGANNLGFHVANTQWVFRNDFDYLIPNDTLENLIDMHLNPKMFYQFSSKFWDGPNQPKNVRGTPANIYIMTREAFWNIGGYDEDFRGMYGSDLLFRWRVLSNMPYHKLNYFVEAIFQGSSHGLSRDNSKAVKLLQDKKLGKITISKDYLRFEWKKTR